MSQDYILLKWGSLKGWKLENPQSQETLKRYLDLGVSMSAMMQKDTSEQKEILCELIRGHDGTITNDWDGEDYTKERAIEYIMNYKR